MKKIVFYCLMTIMLLSSCNTEYPDDYKNRLANSSSIQMEMQILAMIDKNASAKYVDALFDAYQSKYPNYNDLCNASLDEIENIRINTMKQCVKHVYSYDQLAVNLANNSQEIIKLKNENRVEYEHLIKEFKTNLYNSFGTLDNFIDCACDTPNLVQTRIQQSADKAMQTVLYFRTLPRFEDL